MNKLCNRYENLRGKMKKEERILLGRQRLQIHAQRQPSGHFSACGSFGRDGCATSAGRLFSVPPPPRACVGRRTRTWVAAPPPLPRTRAGGPMQTRAELQWAGLSSVTTCRPAPHVSVQSFGYGYDPVSFREEVKRMALFAVTLANVVIRLQNL
jgi:hypothetical protein